MLNDGSNTKLIPEQSEIVRPPSNEPPPHDRSIRLRLKIGLLTAYLGALVIIILEFIVLGATISSTDFIRLGMISVALALVIGYGYFYLRRWIVEPLEKMVRDLSRYQAASATAVILDERAPDEIGQIAKRINERNAAVRVAQSTAEIELAERRRTESQLRASESRLRSISDTSPDAIATADSHGKIISWNPAAAELFGFKPHEVLGKEIFSLLGEADATRHSDVIQGYFNGQVGSLDGGVQEVAAIRKSGENFAAEISLSGWEMEGERFAIAFMRDISGRRDQEERIRFLAHHDPLTSLPNRTLFNDRLEQAVAIGRRTGLRVAVMLIDLDNFKTVNDTLGHGVGDGLLTEVAKRLSDQARETDTIARLGGDEFAVVLPQIQSPENLSVIAERIITSIGEPMVLDGHEVQVGASIGIAIFPDDAEDIESMIAHADMAMYSAKEDGRNTYRLFVAQMDAEVKDRKKMLDDMRDALNENGFHLVFQPQVDIVSSSVAGSEALLRWRHPVRGDVSPGQFIPVAEQGGIIVGLGDWVIEAACRQVKEFDLMGLSHVRVAVNISSVQFRRGALVDTTRAILERENVDASRIEYEITESVVMADIEQAVATMKELDTMGIRLSIDDFGTGYSSLSYLRQFPIQKIKIDKSFVQDIEEDAESMKIVHAIMGLGRSLNLSVVAEGVETEGQLIKLQDAGCELVQGFYFGRPMTSTDFSTWVEDWRRVSP